MPRHEENRIVAEAALTARRTQQHSLPAPGGDQRQRIVGIAHRHHHAHEATTARVIGDCRSRQQKLLEIIRIARTATRVACRIDAGRAAQGIDHEARVVGQRRQSAMPRGMTGLDDSVLDKGRAGFLYRRHVVVRLRADSTIEPCQ